MENNETILIEKMVKLNRVAKVLKGGRRFSFSALTVVGDGKGRVGYGFGKANDVSEAIRKSVDRAKKNMITVPLKRNTLPHEILGKYKSASVLICVRFDPTGGSRYRYHCRRFGSRRYGCARSSGYFM